MENLFGAACVWASARSISPWLYQGSAQLELVELARVQGSAVALPIHFHDEDQITFVVAGRRRFQIHGGLVEVEAGQGFCIEAGTPHSSLCEPAGVVAFNVYVPAGGSERGELLTAMTRCWDETRSLTATELAAMVRAHLHVREWPVATAAVTGQTLRVHGTVHRAAKSSGMTREGFSRAFRRTHGLAPSVFRSLSKLNTARSLLRTGAPLATVAAEAGFADQSHLGRCFRRAFGVTPGDYRSGWARSHPFQTRPQLGL